MSWLMRQAISEEQERSFRAAIKVLGDSEEPSDQEKAREVEEGLFRVLKGHYRLLLLAGVRPSLNEFLALEPVEVRAAARAGYELDCERAYRQSTGMRDAVTAADIFAEVDGGEELEQVVLDTVHRAAVAALEERRAASAKAK